jgi:arylsulfatase A-like enzyme
MHRNLHFAWVLAGTLLSIGCSGSSEETGASGSSRDAVSGSHPVVVLLMDGVRVDHMGAYGAAESATPSLDTFAASAIRFDWAFSQAPEATTSLASLLTGLYPTTHGLVESSDRLVDEALTLPEALAGAGLESAAFLSSSGPFEGRGLEQGFDIFETGPGALDRALQWIGQNAGADFFLVVDLGAVDPAAIDIDNPDESFAEQVGALGQAAERVLAALAAAGLTDRATIAVVSLSGFNLGEHGNAGEPSIYAPETHVPMLLRSPGLGPAKSVDKIVEVIDLGPTLIALIGEEPAAELQGRSLLGLIQGTGTPPYVAFGEAAGKEGGYFAALGGFRLVVRGSDGASELYDLTRDPAEQVDLSASEANRVAVLEDHLSAWKKMVSVASLDPERRTEELDEEALEQLRSLGYIQ